MKRCPYCFEVLIHKESICPHCAQFLADSPMVLDYIPADYKKCIFCGKSILFESKICRYCHHWQDEASEDPTVS